MERRKKIDSLIFGGFHKTSMIDYPGKISCVLFTCGCNFHCPYCHNPSLVKKDESLIKQLSNDKKLDKNNILEFLNKRKNFLDAVVITGGEPTLQKDLKAFLYEINKIGYLVKLDTNGSNPDIIEELIHEDLIDYIAMDIKTKNEYYNEYITSNFNPDRIKSSIDLIMNSGINYEFRTTCVKPVVDESIIQGILYLIKGAKRYVLQQCFVNENVLKPDFFEKKTQFFDIYELEMLKNKALNVVKDCIIRA